MPTTQQTNATNQYNSSSLNSYNAFQPQLQSSLSQMAQNPLGSSYFQNQLAQQQGQAQQIGQRNQSNLLQNMRAGGGILSNSGGFMNAMLQRNTLGNSQMQGNAFNSSMNTALSNRNMALMSMQAYQPLQTGQNTTQTQSGLGTWLPQVAGMAMNALAPGLGSMMGGQGFSAGYGGGGGGGYSGFSSAKLPNMGAAPASGGFGNYNSFTNAYSGPQQ